jgi:dihydrofolate reductase
MSMKTILIAAITADGFIGRTSGHSADWTGSADKKLFVRVTKEMGTIVMGARTFETIGRALPGRRNIIYTHHPEAITAEGVETTNESPTNLLRRLKSEGTTGVAICGGAQIYTLFMQAGLIDELYLTNVAVLFGTGVKLFSNALDAQLKLLDTQPLDDRAVMLHYSYIRESAAS